jgi:hypothetical protein
MVEREREIVIRPVKTNALDLRWLNRKIGPALRTTPNSIRLRLLELEMPWQEAIDAILNAIEQATGGDSASSIRRNRRQSALR